MHFIGLVDINLDPINMAETQAPFWPVNLGDCQMQKAILVPIADEFSVLQNEANIFGFY